MGLSGTKLDVVVVPQQQECPALQTGGCKRGNTSHWCQDSREGSVVCYQYEATAIDVLVELANTVDQRQSFLLQLGIVSLTWLQGPRSICHRMFCPIWQDVGEDSSNSVIGSISCQMDGQFGIVHQTGTQLLLHCLKSSHAWSHFQD